MGNPEKAFKIETYLRPGLRNSDTTNLVLIQQLRSVASECFEQLPNYQSLAFNPRALDDKVIAVARDQSGGIVAFCSGLIIDVPDVGDVFHTGLTCIAPCARSSGLTHKLTQAAMLKYVFSSNPFRKLWISNVACVLSSLGNVAAFMEQVYPSPYGPSLPTSEHAKIAATINDYYRSEIFISQDADFDSSQFVFRGSVQNTMFQKSPDDDRYQHRSQLLNAYYKELLDFDRGDEVCQIGYVNLFTALKHTLRIKPKVKQCHPPTSKHEAETALISQFPTRLNPAMEISR